jgi:hypothetical protein
MPEIAKEALELAVRAADAGEDEEITVRRARAFYEFLRAPVGASAQESLADIDTQRFTAAMRAGQTNLCVQHPENAV